ncbi:hypothetical protein O1611_g2466 [Lasiodiplodia mahajangana]|uniref:Uncharacterized protein n=1 Tax=Lasiodiplodia mahajangana TaxID=1108764 RepID=A0ACC2JUK3_9PEZI|nr:hypothetical protein O1611_g2466 [Lasiodiplodia mahajangana]
MQCVNAPQPCEYPDQGKRGLPAGFLSALETRLQETERALFYALSELHEGIIEHGAYSGHSNPAQTKNDMMEKWASLPLGDRAQAKAWFLNRRAGDPWSINVGLGGQSRTQTGPTMATPSDFGPSHDAISPSSQVQDSTFLQSPTAADYRLPSQESGTFTPSTIGPPLTPSALMPDSHSPIHGSGLSTRAQAVAKSRRNMYF